MDKLIVIVLLVAAVIYFKYGDDDIVPVRPLYAESYVVVYGRQACGNTQYMEKTLNRSALQFYSGDFDDPVIREEIYGRMTMAGYDINKNFMLPIVDVNGWIMTNPDPQEVIGKYVEIK